MGEHIPGTEYSITLSFEPVSLPPVTDVLVLGSKYPHGRNGVLMAFKYIAPDEFHCVDLSGDPNGIEAVFIERKILAKIPAEKILAILREYVFPYVSPDEAVKVDLRVVLRHKGIEGTL